MNTDVAISGLQPRDMTGHQFVVYGDSCSGVPGGVHEATTAAVNAVVARLDPPPEFICFLGDEVIGLTTSEAQLRSQWRHWLGVEMAWLDRTAIPLYHTTGNHTTYDAMSERVFQDVMGHLPANGPEDQAHLTYAVRRGNLLLVFVNTMFTGLGEGRVETVWLDAILAQHADALYRLVFGHHPVFPINGFGGEYQRELEHANGRAFWDLLVRHQVDAYFGSHMLAFDARVVDGVLHLVTAGAGTKHRMPETEYLHAMQVALDAGGLRFQVLDDEGRIREALDWPPRLPASSTWPALAERDEATDPLLRVWQIGGICPESGGSAQTFVSAGVDDGLPPIWIGLQGPEQRLSVLLSPQAGRSPHLWYGPTLLPGQAFSIQVALHSGLGPGGMLWRYDDEAPWNSLSGASAWGAERLPPITRWQAGISGSEGGRPFRGRNLRITTMSISGA